MKVNKVYFMLMAQDMGRAVRYWRAMGLDLRLETPEWSELGWRDATVALHGGGDGREAKTGLGLEVDDVEAACAIVEKAGGTVMMRPQARPAEPIRLAMARDPEGNVYSLVERIG